MWNYEQCVYRIEQGLRGSDMETWDIQRYRYIYILYNGDCSRSGVRLCPVGTMIYVGHPGTVRYRVYPVGTIIYVGRL